MFYHAGIVWRSRPARVARGSDDSRIRYLCQPYGKLVHPIRSLSDQLTTFYDVISNLGHYDFRLYRSATAESAALSLGYSSLKPEQRDVIVEFVLGSDVFAILPTGYGKSLYYACLPRVYNYLLDATSFIVVVVTPLT